MGLLVAVPAVVLAGPLYARTLRGIVTVPRAEFAPEPEAEKAACRARVNSFLSSLLPVLVLGRGAGPAGRATGRRPAGAGTLAFLADPGVVMLLAVVRGHASAWAAARAAPWPAVMETYGAAIRDVALLLLIIGGAGALKEVLVASGAGQAIASRLAGHGPAAAGAGLAALRASFGCALGSATVAGPHGGRRDAAHHGPLSP